MADSLDVYDRGPVLEGRVLPPAKTGRQRSSFYETYNTRYVQDEPPIGGDPGVGFAQTGRIPSRAQSAFQRLPNGNGIKVVTPKGIPSFLGARPILFYAWLLAMAMVAWDDWHTLNVLPRPARLWSTTWTFAMLAVVSVFDVAVPLVNIVAIGLVIAVAYNYYTGNGGFGQFGAGEASTPTFDASKATP